MKPELWPLQLLWKRGGEKEKMGLYTPSRRGLVTAQIVGPELLFAERG